jgi:hypothetical protein
MNREPTVTQIVDRILALDWGESCDVKLNPHITRVGNLEWLLPICVRQFGTEIAIREHPEGGDVVLTITAMATSKHKTCQSVSREEPNAEREDQLASVGDSQLAVVA